METFHSIHLKPKDLAFVGGTTYLVTKVTKTYYTLVCLGSNFWSKINQRPFKERHRTLGSQHNTIYRNGKHIFGDDQVKKYGK